MISFKEFVLDTNKFLSNNKKCSKHNIEHSGKNIYAVDFLLYENKINEAKDLILEVVSKLTKDGDNWVFYPGRINHNNHSNNAIDCGAIIDCACRFLMNYESSLSNNEKQTIQNAIDKVVNSYLKNIVLEKPITNQRLWALTGLASYYKYSKDDKLIDIIESAIEKSFSDMTDDGFFIYYPQAEKYKSFSGYDGPTTYYQSRCTAFIYYVIDVCDLDVDKYQDRLEKSITALISMYKTNGVKDLNLECKKWYWLSDYEVASASFDLFALSCSNNSYAKDLINNILFQLKRHLVNGEYISHKGVNFNFQCSVFWTSHLAWVSRIKDIEDLWSKSNELKNIEWKIVLDKVINISKNNKQIILNKIWQKRNFTSGIYTNGLPISNWFFKWGFISPNRSMLLSVRENVNHMISALKGFHILEFIYRGYLMKRELVISILNIYKIKYGKILDIEINNNGRILVKVEPATKFGKLFGRVFLIEIDNGLNCLILDKK